MKDVARDLFRIGQRVKMSAHGRDHFEVNLKSKRPMPTAGVVVGFGRDAHLVRIRLDDRSPANAITFHASLWESAE